MKKTVESYKEQVAEFENQLAKADEHFNELLAEEDCKLGSLVAVAKTIKTRLAKIAELKDAMAVEENAVEEIDAAEVGDNDKAIEIQQINAYIRSERNQIENCNIAIDSFKNELKYLEKSFNKYLEKNDAAGMVDAAETIKSKLQYIAKVEVKIANCEKRIETLKAELAQYTEKTAVEEEIENLLDEIDNGKFAVKSIENEIEQITAEFNEVKETAEQAKAKEIQFLIDCANEEIEFAKKRIADAMKEIDRKNINNAKAEVAGMKERIEYAYETMNRAISILADVEEKAAVKFEVGKVYFAKNCADCYGATMLFKVVNRDNQKVTLQYFETPPRHCADEHKPGKYTIYPTKGNVECVYISEGYTLNAKDLHSGKYAGVNATDDKYEELIIVDGVIQEESAEVEIENADNTAATNEPKQFEVGKWYYNCSVLSIGHLAYKVIRRTKKLVTLTDTFGEVIKRKPETSFGVEEISFGADEILSANHFGTNIDEIQKAEEQLEYSIAQNAEDDAKYESQQTRIAAYYAGKIDDDGNEKIKHHETAEVIAKIDKLKAKVAEQKKPRKSIIDWTATLRDYAKQDIKILQNDLRRFIEIGEIELAAKTFETIKKNYRALYAA